MLYLWLLYALQAAIEKIERCSEQDSCDCQRLFHLEALPWSNKFSRTLKQISIARWPKVCVLTLTCFHIIQVLHV